MTNITINIVTAVGAVLLVARWGGMGVSDFARLQTSAIMSHLPSELVLMGKLSQNKANFR
jgi:hypothetical protein